MALAAAAAAAAAMAAGGGGAAETAVIDTKTWGRQRSRNMAAPMRAEG